MFILFDDPNLKLKLKMNGVILLKKKKNFFSWNTLQWKLLDNPFVLEPGRAKPTPTSMFWTGRIYGLGQEKTENITETCQVSIELMCLSIIHHLDYLLRKMVIRLHQISMNLINDISDKSCNNVVATNDRSGYHSNSIIGLIKISMKGLL